MTTSLKQLLDAASRPLSPEMRRPILGILLAEQLDTAESRKLIEEIAAGAAAIGSLLLTVRTCEGPGGLREVQFHGADDEHRRAAPRIVSNSEETTSGYSSSSR